MNWPGKTNETDDSVAILYVSGELVWICSDLLTRTEHLSVGGAQCLQGTFKFSISQTEFG